VTYKKRAGRHTGKHDLPVMRSFMHFMQMMYPMWETLNERKYVL